MTVSRLSCKNIISPNCYAPRAYKISRVTIHHMAGNLTVEGCGSVFASPSRQASSNYGIGSDGRIACYVKEENAAWTSSSYDNDNRAITIEVANSNEGVNNGTWAITDKAYQSMIALCADICIRYGIIPTYTGDVNGTFTEHRMFAPTGCPGDWIHARMRQIVKDVADKMASRSDKNSHQVQLYTANGSKAQKWRPKRNGDGTYTLISAANGMALDVKGASAKGGATVQAYKPNGSAAQRWKISRKQRTPKMGKYSPKDIAPWVLEPSCAPNLRLTIKGGSKKNGAGIAINAPSHSNYQNWQILDNGDGTWTLVNVASGKMLDLKNGGA